MIASPCNKVCVMDPETGFCRGCRRTLDEIARWATMQDAERMLVWQELAKRPKAPGSGPARAADQEKGLRDLS